MNANASDLHLLETTDNDSEPTSLPLRASPSLVAVALAACVPVGLAGVLLRLWQFAPFSDLPSDFNGPIAFRARYLVTHHAFLTHDVPAYSYWSAGANTHLGFYLYEAIQAFAYLVSQSTGLTLGFLHSIALEVLLLTLSTAIVLQSEFASNRVRAFRDSLIVGAILTLGTPVVINYMTGWNVAYAYVILMLAALVYISNLGPQARVIAFIGLLVASCLLYHTFAFLLVFFLVILYVLAKLAGDARVIPNPLTLVVIYLTYEVYVAIQFFGAIVKGVSQVLTLRFLSNDVVNVAIAPADVAGINLKYLHVIVYASLALSIALVSLLTIREIRQRGSKAMEFNGSRARFGVVITSMAISVVVLGGAFGFKFSPEFLINRGATYLVVPGALSVAYWLRFYPQLAKRTSAVSLTLVAISITAFCFEARTIYSTNKISLGEARAYNWLLPRLQKTDVVFTDFRLSGPFIAAGHMRVVGIGQGESVPSANRLLQAIYYSGSWERSSAAIASLRTYRDHRSPDYIFLSRGITASYPGLTSYGGHFLSPLPNLFSWFGAGYGWHLVYRHSGVYVYHKG